MTYSPVEEPPKNPQNEISNSPPPTQQQPARIPVELPVQRPVVTYVILGVTIIFYLMQVLSDLLLGVDYLAYFGMKINEFIQLGQVWRLFTPMLLHGSPLHIGFNMYALYSIGRSLERYYGHFRFILLYIVAGFAGNVVSFLFTTAPSLGASTAIFGLIAAEGVFIFNNRSLFGKQQSQRMLSNIGMIILINLMLGTSASIDNMGHLGGLLGGLAYSWLAGPLLQLRQDAFSFRLEDKRSPSQAWISAFGVIAIFSIAVIANILFL